MSYLVSTTTRYENTAQKQRARKSAAAVATVARSGAQAQMAE